MARFAATTLVGYDAVGEQYRARLALLVGGLGLVYATSLTSPITWSPDVTPVVVIAGRNTVTIPIGAGPRFLSAEEVVNPDLTPPSPGGARLALRSAELRALSPLLSL